MKINEGAMYGSTRHDDTLLHHIVPSQLMKSSFAFSYWREQPISRARLRCASAHCATKHTAYAQRGTRMPNVHL